MRGGIGRAIALVLAGLVAASLTGCSGRPSQQELDGAAAAHAGGIHALAHVVVPTPEGFEIAAEHRVDACGSLTSDRGGLDDTHLEGYSCAAIRRTVYTSTTASADDSRYATALAEIQKARGLQLDPHGRSADGSLTVDGKQLRISAMIWRTADVDVDMLPLWHANQTVLADDGDLVPKLKKAGSTAPTVLMVTTTVTYFDRLRSDGAP